MICSSPRTIATTRETKIPRTSQTINPPIFLFRVNEIQNPKTNSVSLTRNRIFVLREKKQRMPIEQSSPSNGGGGGGGGSSSSSSSSSSSLILTSGASGRINALFSIRSLKSLLMVVYSFVLLLLGPFRGRRRAAAIGSSPRDHHHQKSMAGGSGAQRRGNTTTLVPRKGKASGACAVLDQEVAARRALAIRRVLEDKEKHSDSAREFSLFTSPRGDTIFTQSWSPVSAKIRALVVVLHGLNEHSGRYNDFAKQLNAQGFKVYGMDWIGHGGSDGLHAYVHSLDDAVTDLKFFLDKLLAENPGLPCFCFGHSTGAAIVLKAVLIPEVEARVAGIVLTSPAVGVQPSHPIFVVLAPVFSFLLPRFQLSVANKKGSLVSRDPEALVVKYSDPLVYTGSIRVRTGYEILRITTYLRQNLHNVRVPFLVLHGSADTVTDPDASQKLYEEASSTDKTIKLYEGFLHDLLFELEREDVVNEIIKWLNSRV